NRYAFSRSLNLEYNQLVKDMKNLIPLYPDFRYRDKSRLTFTIIKDVVHYFNLHPNFIDNATSVYNHFYSLLQLTSEEFCAGVIFILTLIASGIRSIPIAQVCERICISNGSISNRIRKYIIPKLDIPNFRSLVHSRDIIKDKLLSLMKLQSVPEIPVKILVETPVKNPVKTSSNKEVSLKKDILMEQSHLLLDTILERINNRRNRYDFISRTEFLIYTNVRTIRKNINYFIKLLFRRKLRRNHKRIVGISIAFACPKATLIDISRLIQVSGSTSLSELFQKISCKQSFMQYSSKFPYLDLHYAKEVFRIFSYRIRKLDLGESLDVTDYKAEVIENEIEKMCKNFNREGFRVKEAMIVAICIFLSSPKFLYNDIRNIMKETLNFYVNQTTFSSCLTVMRKYQNSHN
ncbi:MAG: hypothetical protein ACFFDF_17540, partial [Candidatus Odinarchaeota archaeon]